MEKDNSLLSEPSKSVENSPLELNLSKKQLILIYIIIGILFLIPNIIKIFWPLGNDDSIYMGTIKMIMEGKLPYRDFIFGTTPLFYYMNGLIAYLFKLDLIPLRVFSFLFGLSGIILIGFISYRLGGHVSSIISITISATTFHNAAYLSDIYFVSMANFFLIVAIALQIYCKDSYYKIFLITGALIISFGIRSTNMICILVYGIFNLIINGKLTILKKIMSYIISIIMFSFLIFGFSLISSFNQIIMNLFYFPMKLYPSWGLQFDLSKQIFYFFYLMADFPIVFIGLIFTIIFYWIDRGKIKFNLLEFLRSQNENKNTCLLLVFLLVALILFQITFMSYPDYPHILFYFPLMTILAAWYYKPYIIMGLQSSVEIRRLTIVFISLVIFISYLTGPFNLFKAILILKKEYKYSTNKQINLISEEIIRRTKPDDKIFTFTSALAIYSKRNVLPGLERGFSGYSPIWNSEEVKKYHVYNFQQIKIWFQSKSAAMIIFTDLDKNSPVFKESSPSGKIFWNNFYTYLNQNYKIIFIKRIDDYYWGNAYAYIPK